MDEVLKAKRLTEEILQRAQSIRMHMDSVNESLANMQDMERRSANRTSATTSQPVPQTHLMDLPDDCLAALVSAIPKHDTLCALAQTCRKFHYLVEYDYKGWEARCRTEWGVCEVTPEEVPRLETGLLASLPASVGTGAAGLGLSGTGVAGLGLSGTGAAGLGTGAAGLGTGATGLGTGAVGLGLSGVHLPSHDSNPQGRFEHPLTQPPPHSPSQHRQVQQESSVRNSAGAAGDAATGGGSSTASATALEQRPAGSDTGGMASSSVASADSGRPEGGGAAPRGVFRPWSAQPQSPTGARPAPSSTTATLDASPATLDTSLAASLVPRRCSEGGHGSPGLLRTVRSSSGGGTPGVRSCGGATSSTACRQRHATEPLQLQDLLAACVDQERESAGEGELVGPFSPKRTSGRWQAMAVESRVRQWSSGGFATTGQLESGSLWRLIYRDRVQGWQLVTQMLQWLRNHGCPRGVTGSVHRVQLSLALKYMALGTSQPQDKMRKQEILNTEGLRALLSLLDNESGEVVETAATVLANLMQDDPDTKVQVMIGSRMGKLFTDKLDQGVKAAPAVMYAMSRALATMWVDVTTIPEIRVLDPHNRPARPDLDSGLWQLQEYTLRGERTLLIHLYLTFEHTEGEPVTQITGAGVDQSSGRAEEFEVSGALDTRSWQWSWHRRFLVAQHVIQYRGYSDSYGSFGTYSIQWADTAQAARSFAAPGGQRHQRIYRLFRDTQIQSVE